MNEFCDRMQEVCSNLCTMSGELISEMSIGSFGMLASSSIYKLVYSVCGAAGIGMSSGVGT